LVGEETPDVDALVAELRARVEERRRAGAYPAGLEDELAVHARQYGRRQAEAWRRPELRPRLRAVEEALPLGTARIPLESEVPGGQAVHRAIGRLVRRQTQGVLEQVEAFARPVHEAVAALVDAVEVFHPWYSSERFEDEFRGSRETMLERYRDLAQRLEGCGPVLDIGCGRGEFLELLSGLGIEAWGVDLDAELVRAAAEQGLEVEQGDGLRCLGRLEEASLGALVLIQVVEHMSAQGVVDLVALAAEKLRPGGRVFVETVNPQSLYVFAHSFYLDPTHVRPIHPAYLTFLFREAGFSAVEVEWRSPPPAADVLEEVSSSSKLTGPVNANTRRLNQLLFAPQDYLVLATR
jgi:SAM-dependent methyltransferase